MNRPHFYQPFLGLLDFLIEIVEYWRIEEFSQGHIQTVTEFLDHIDRDFFPSPIQNAVNCRWRHARQICQFIRTYCPLPHMRKTKIICTCACNDSRLKSP